MYEVIRMTIEESGQTVLELKDLKTHFVTRWGVVKAVDGVSFKLKKGETLGVVGESGSGKSVTSLSIMRLVPSPPGHIVGGKILLEGEDILQLSEQDMQQVRGGRVAMVLQDPMTALNPVFNIENQVAEPLKIHKKMKGKDLKTSVIDMLLKVRIPAPDVRMKDYPHQLSGGMRQRVIGAIGLSCNPVVLIADEPTTALDVTIQAQIVENLKNLQQRSGMSVLFITHNLGLVAEIADRVLGLYAGQVGELGKVKALFDQPLMPYTKALLQSIPHLGCSNQPDYRIEAIQGNVPSATAFPSGCAFHPRCRYFVPAVCDASEPGLEDGAADHLVRCFRWQEIPEGAGT